MLEIMFKECFYKQMLKDWKLCFSFLLSLTTTDSCFLGSITESEDDKHKVSNTSVVVSKEDDKNEILKNFVVFEEGKANPYYDVTELRLFLSRLLSRCFEDEKFVSKVKADKDVYDRMLVVMGECRR